jgi:diacylglycerol kinase (ATP)
MKIICKLRNSFVWSVAGLKYAFNADLSFKIESILVLVMLPLACWIANDKIELILLIMSLVIVLITELLNTAIETVVDRISLDNHMLSMHAKDVGSAAVFCSLLQVAIVWGICIF